MPGLPAASSVRLASTAKAILSSHPLPVDSMTAMTVTEACVVPRSVGSGDAVVGSVSAAPAVAGTPPASSPDTTAASPPTFANWSATRTRTPAKVVTATCLADIQAAVRDARAAGQRVRAVARAHTWSDVFVDDGDVLLDVSRLDAVTALDAAAQTVTVQAGVTTADLIPLQLETGLFVASNVILDTVTYAGIVNAACHGTGWAEGTVSDYVVAMTIVDADGMARVFAEDTCDADTWAAVLCNLGTWGVIYDITLRLRAMANIAVENHFRPQGDYFATPADHRVAQEKKLARLRHVVERSTGVELFWMPFNRYYHTRATGATWTPAADDLWLRVFNETTEEVTHGAPAVRAALTAMQAWQMRLSDWAHRTILSARPLLVPAFYSLGFHTIKLFPQRMVERVPHAIHYQAHIDSFKVVSFEVAVPLTDAASWAAFSAMWTSVTRRVAAEHADGRCPLTLAMEARFVRSSAALLAPSYAPAASRHDTHHVYVEILSAAAAPGWSAFRDAVAAEWLAVPGARVHWSKQFPDAAAAGVAAAHGDALRRFKAARAAAGVDAPGMFVNNWLAAALGMPDAWRALPGGVDRSGVPVALAREAAEAAAMADGRWRWGVRWLLALLVVVGALMLALGR